MRLYTLTSDLHGELARSARNEQFIKDIETALGEEFDYRDSDFSDFGALGDIIYVRTGGTEGLFRELFAGHEGARVRLLTSGESNSLAASMEILSWLNQQGLGGEIIHGSLSQIVSALLQYYPSSRPASSIVRPFEAEGLLKGKRFGVVGMPSDWLISSGVDYAAVKRRLGVELIDIPISEVLHGAAPDAVSIKPLNAPRYGKPFPAKEPEAALAVYGALKGIVDKYKLDGLTLRCFDLLTELRTTGCLALSLLNSEGLVATCEGDIPAMLSMALMRERYGVSGFQANLSRVDGSGMLFAHCTVPINMCSDYCYDTHFESGIGIGIHGILPQGPGRLFKLSSDLSRCVDMPVEIIGNTYEEKLCRTQVLVRGSDALRTYLLREPLGNHHIIVPLAHVG